MREPQRERSAGHWARPQRRNGRRPTSALEAIAVLFVVAAVVAMAIWFIFISSGGIGPGTV